MVLDAIRVLDDISFVDGFSIDCNFLFFKSRALLNLAYIVRLAESLELRNEHLQQIPSQPSLLGKRFEAVVIVQHVAKRFVFEVVRRFGCYRLNNLFHVIPIKNGKRWKHICVFRLPWRLSRWLLRSPCL